jgi:2-C-methyl-D-erythritol 4-phosphate cytidylyltransferase
MPLATEVILVAAGEGRRMQGVRPKAFLPLAGRPLFMHALELFGGLEEINGIILVVPLGEEEATRSLASQGKGSEKIRAVVAGGARRQDSVRAGLDQLHGLTEIVLIHDAARPFFTAALVRRVIQAAGQTGAAVPGTPVVDTLKRLNEAKQVEATIERRHLAAIQTPQGFRTAVLKEAYHNAWKKNVAATDDAGLVECLGLPISVVEGESRNFKLTTPDDLVLAEAWLAVKRKS